jgi:hypothetical protein
VDLHIDKDLHQRLFLLRLKDGCGLLYLFDDFPSATNNVKPNQGGAGAITRHRHGLEVEDEGHLKNFVVILFLLRCFVLFNFFNTRVLFAKTPHDRIRTEIYYFC